MIQWLCTEHVFAEAARATLPKKHLGCVAVSDTPAPPCPDAEATIVTGKVCCGDEASRGDVIICSTSGPRSAVQEAVRLLRAETGSQGSWLDDDVAGAFRGDVRLHYAQVDSSSGRVGLPDALNELTESLTRLVASIVYESAPLTVSGHTPVLPLILVLGLGDDEILTTRTAVYATELIDRAVRVPNLRNPSPITVLPPPNITNLQMPALPPRDFPLLRGSDILLIIPTENQAKTQLLTRHVTMHAAPRTVHTVSIPTPSCVGEQPYDTAGLAGVHSRITTALDLVQSSAHAHLFTNLSLGAVVVGAVESFVQTRGVARAVDYALVVLHCASSGKTAWRVTQGVEVPEGFVERARRFGYVDGNTSHGRVTVGRILAAHVDTVHDKADWQRDLAQVSRYDIIDEALQTLPTVW